MQIRRWSGRATIIAAAILTVGVPRLWAQQRPMVVDTGFTKERLQPYIKSLGFRSDHVTSDTRPLDWPRTREVARIEPETTTVLPDSGGRIAARIVNLSSVAVPRFALLPEGTTYIWAQDDRPDHYAIYISTDSHGRVVNLKRVQLSSAAHVDSSLYRIETPMARFNLHSSPEITAVGSCFTRCKIGPWCTAGLVAVSGN